MDKARASSPLKNLWQTGTARSLLIAVLVVLGLGLVNFSAGLSAIGPMDRDEARFAQASKQMVTSGDYVTPHFQKDLRAKKPIGIYWMQSFSAHIFGKDNIFSYRIPSFLGGLLAAILTTIFALQILPRREAILAGLFMASSFVLVVESHLAKTDAMLAAVIIAQQLTLWKIRQLHDADQYVSGKYAALFWGMMAAGILIKGPIAPLLAVLTMAMIILAGRQWKDGEWRWVLAVKPVLGLIILTALVMPWVLLVTSATDGAFLNIAVKGDFVAKLKSGQESHGAPPLYFLALMVITFWPGSFFFARAIKAIRPRWREADMIFLLGWLLPFWIILELTPTKLPHYNLPVFAALAILMVMGINQTIPAQKPRLGKPPSPEKPLALLKRHLKSFGLIRSAIILWEAFFMIMGPVLGIVIIFAATFADGSRPAAFIAFLAACLVSACGFWWQRRGKILAVYAMLASASLFYVMVLGVVLPGLEGIRLAPRIKAEVAAITPAPALITSAGYHEPSLVFELGTDTLLFSPDEAAFFMAEAEDGLALIERRSDAQFRQVAQELGITLEIIKTIKGHNISRGQDVEILFYRRLSN